MAVNSPSNSLHSDPTLVLISVLPVFLCLFGVVVLDVDSAELRLLAGVSSVFAIAVVARCVWKVGVTVELPSVVILLGMVFWFYIPILTTVLKDESWIVHAARVIAFEDDTLRALLAVNLVFGAIIIMAQLRIPRRITVHGVRFLGNNSFTGRPQTVLFLGVAILVALIFYAAASGGIVSAIRFAIQSRTIVKPWDHQGYEGTALTPLNVLSISVLIGSGAVAIIYGLVASRLSIIFKVIVVLLGILAIGWVSLATGTRSLLLQGTMPAMLLVFRQMKKRKTRVRSIVLLATGFILLVFAANAQRAYRYSAEVSDGPVFSIDDSNMFNLTALAFAVQRQEERYLYDSAVIHIVTGPIPRFLWKGKPKMDSMLLFTEYVWGSDESDTGRNTLPSVVGQYFLNWGWFGVLELGLIMGLLLRVCDHMFFNSRTRSGTQMGTIAFVTYLFVSMRMLSFAYFTPMLLTLLIARYLSRSEVGTPST